MLSRALVAVPAAYFLGGTGAVQGSESIEEFFQSYHNICERWRDGQMRWAAGLLSTGFTIEMKPLLVSTPVQKPEATLDLRLYMENSYLVAPTILAMGICATSEGPLYNEGIECFVDTNIGPGKP
jgi:hypothetical protein